MKQSITLSREQVRRLDRLAIEEYKVPGVVLMENAGRAVAEVVGNEASLPGPIVILCGSGNNAGDGYVTARHLANAGRDVCLVAAKAPDALAGDAAIHARIAVNMRLPLEIVDGRPAPARLAEEWSRAGGIVDALLGTGFHGAPRDPMRGMIEACNTVRGPKVVAVDLPSGLDCDTGRPADPTVRADITVSFVARKAGFDRPEAQAWLGRVVVADIGAPIELLSRVRGRTVTPSASRDG